MTEEALVVAPDADLLKLTAEIVSAHVAHSDVAPDALPGLIKSVYDALSGASAPQTAEPEKPVPAVPPKRSVFPDYIVCLEDGKKLKMLKRHLQQAFGMTPDQYRQRWGLPKEYPMVAPNYAERRASLARDIGLGRKITAQAPEPQPEPQPEVVQGVEVTKVPAKRRGRKPAAA